MKTINFIKTSEGFLVNLPASSSKFINGERLLPTYNTNWSKVISISEPKTLTESFNKVVERVWKLKPQISSFSQLPATLEYFDYDDMKTRYPDYEGFYEPFTTYEEGTKEVKVQFVKIAEVDLVPGIVPFRYQTKDPFPITEKSVKYPLVSTITVPDILLPETPCFLSSKETYEIIREFVKRNINPKAAEVTSDYDFCFEVSKLVELHEPEPFQFNLNWNRKRAKPKYETRFRADRKVKCFSMTHDERNYESYPVIEGFSANSQRELKEKIDNYLKELIENINEPLIECPCCKGLGVVENRDLVQ